MFEIHGFKVGRPAKDVKTAIIQTLQTAPTAFQVYYQDAPQHDVYEMLARQEFSMGPLGGSLRLCLMVVGQTRDDETQVLYKVLADQVQHTIVGENLKFRDDKRLIPIGDSNSQIPSSSAVADDEGKPMGQTNSHRSAIRLTRGSLKTRLFGAIRENKNHSHSRFYSHLGFLRE